MTPLKRNPPFRETIPGYKSLSTIVRRGDSTHFCLMGGAPGYFCPHPNRNMFSHFMLILANHYGPGKSEYSYGRYLRDVSLFVTVPQVHYTFNLSPRIVRSDLALIHTALSFLTKTFYYPVEEVAFRCDCQSDY